MSAPPTPIQLHHGEITTPRQSPRNNNNNNNNISDSYSDSDSDRASASEYEYDSDESVVAREETSELYNSPLYSVGEMEPNLVIWRRNNMQDENVFIFTPYIITGVVHTIQVRIIDKTYGHLSSETANMNDLYFTLYKYGDTPEPFIKTNLRRIISTDGGGRPSWHAVYVKLKRFDTVPIRADYTWIRDLHHHNTNVRLLTNDEIQAMRQEQQQASSTNSTSATQLKF